MGKRLGMPPKPKKKEPEKEPKYKPSFKKKKTKLFHETDLTKNEVIINQITKETCDENKRKVVEKIYKEQENLVFSKSHISRFVRDYQKRQQALANVPKFSLDMVNDDNKLAAYLNVLHEDIDSTDELDYLLKEITNNILNQYKRFNDPRHLRSSNIEAINELIKTRVDIKFKKINSKKVLFDIINKKKELDLKFRNVVNESNMVDGIFNIKDLLNSMDKENIHADIVIDADDAKFIHDLDETSYKNNSSSDNIDKLNELDQEDDKNIIPLEALKHRGDIALKICTNDYSENMNDEMSSDEEIEDQNLL